MPHKIHDYLQRQRAELPTFILPRRFATHDRWQQFIMDGGQSYLGVFSEMNPDLTSVLSHRRVLILGEPGAGKSMIAHAIVKNYLEAPATTFVPILIALKEYDGNLSALLPIDAADEPSPKAYILDGADEIAPPSRATLTSEIANILQTDPSAQIILTARQAYYEHHRDLFPTDFATYHLLDFSDDNIRTCIRHHDVNAERFLAAVRDADCEQEIHNPFVLDQTVRRYKQRGTLSPLRSANVKFVVDTLIQSHPVVNEHRQRRALQMLAVACETAARNTLTENEAIRVINEAMNLQPEDATQLLDELTHSILNKVGDRFSFRMRSHGEFLAAEELQREDMHRVKELAFIGNTPIDTWQNTIAYLAEMNDGIRAYFVVNHPEWLLSVSPHAFVGEEPKRIVTKILTSINDTQSYLVKEDRVISWWRLARLLSPEAEQELSNQLQSPHDHERGNALVLLAMKGHAEIVPFAMKLLMEHRYASDLRYSALVAVANAGNHDVLAPLLQFTQPDDHFHINLVDTIGSLCTPEDFSTILPLMESTNAVLTGTHAHFHAMRSREALTAALQYITDHLQTLSDYTLDSYLEPLLKLIPEYWDIDIAEQIGRIIAKLELTHYHDGRIMKQIIEYAKTMDIDGDVITAMLKECVQTDTVPRNIIPLIAPLINEPTARRIVRHSPTFAGDLARWLPPGSVRDILAPLAPALQAEYDRVIAEHRSKRETEERQRASAREQHQDTIRTSTNLYDVLKATMTIDRSNWPSLSPARTEWLANAANEELTKLNLGETITRPTPTRWQEPQALRPLLKLVDGYHFHLANDVPLVLALRAWPYEEIGNYALQLGLSEAARAGLQEQLRVREHEPVIENTFSFLRQTNFEDAQIQTLLAEIIGDSTCAPRLRTRAMGLIPRTAETTPLFARIATDPDESVQQHAFDELIQRQHRPTISRAIARLTNEQLCAAETVHPNPSPLNWIGTIAIPDVTNELRTLRDRALRLQLLRVASLCITSVANVDKEQAARIIREQLLLVPPKWQDYMRQEAERLERTGRIERIQRTPFDEVIRKLKGSTSMIALKVFCEGTTDRPIFKTLFTQAREHEIASTLDYVGGWPNLRSEEQPERWLDGCREAVIIMDGDLGRELHKHGQPLTEQAKEIQRRFREHRLTLYVLRRHAIENYIPQRAFEKVLGQNLSAYFPIPIAAKVTDLLPGYNKGRNQEAAEYISLADIAGTDLNDIIEDITQKAAQLRQY